MQRIDVVHSHLGGRGRSAAAATTDGAAVPITALRPAPSSGAATTDSPSASSAVAAARRPRVAAIVTAYFPQSHADVIITKLIKGYSTDDGFVQPSVDVVSLFMDQVVLPPFDNTPPLDQQTASMTTPGGRNPQDIGLVIATEHGIPVYSTIPRALYEGDHHYARTPAPPHHNLISMHPITAMLPDNSTERPKLLDAGWMSL